MSAETDEKELSVEPVSGDDDKKENKTKTPQKKEGFDIPFPDEDTLNVVRPAGSDMCSSLDRYKNRPELVHCKKRVIIPFVIPLENRAAKESQKGMGGFGRARDPKIIIDQGAKPLSPDDKRGQTVLSAFAERNKYASQCGTAGFGAYRNNVSTASGGKEIDPQLSKLSDGIIPKQAGTNKLPSLVGQTPIGAKRNQVGIVHYKEDMDDGKLDPEGETFVKRIMAPNPNCRAGTSDLDTFRSQTQEARFNPPKKDQKSEGIVPKLFDPRLSPGSDAFGTGAGMYGLKPGRQVTMKVVGGYEFTSEEIMASKKAVPWSSRARLQSQAGMGGFNKPRDVVTHPVKF